MKKCFLIFGFFWGIGGGTAFAAEPDPCLDAGTGMGDTPVACVLCLDYLNVVYGLYVNMGLQSCQQAAAFPEWQNMLNNIEKSLEFDRDNSFQNCSWQVDDIIVNLDSLATDVCNGGTPEQICFSSWSFCNCSSGYYKLDDASCGKCPGDGTSYGGIGGITQCFIPAGTGGTDSTGTWVYNSNCYYSE